MSELTVTLGRLDRAISRNQRGADEVLLLKLADAQNIFCFGISVKVFKLFKLFNLNYKTDISISFSSRVGSGFFSKPALAAEWLSASS